MKFLTHLKTRALRYIVGLLSVAVLVIVNLKVEEEYPFSNFPMYGNPRADDVDYYFLTDATGQPLSTNDYAGITAPQIKKRLNKLLKEDKIYSKVKKGEVLSSPELDAAAQKVLTKMREDAANPSIQPPLITWPAGVQLKQALIETTPDGFRESFRTVATLPDAGPATGGEHHQGQPPGDATAGMILMLKDFGQFYLLLFGAALLLILCWKWIPPALQNWLKAGTGKFSIGRLEAFFIRAGLAYVMWQALQVRVQFDSLPHPSGLAHWEWTNPAILWTGVAENWDLVLKWAPALLVWYVIGWANVVPLTLITGAHVLERTLYASQGAPHHGHQMLDTIFIAQTIIAWVLFFMRSLGTKKALARPGNETLPWIAMAVIIGAAYVITAFEKWDESKGKWLQNSHYFSNQIVKTYRQNYYNDLNPKFLEGEKQLVQTTADPENDRYRHPIPVQAQWMLTNPTLSKIFFGMGFLLEFTAFLVFFNRGLAALYGLGFMAFHLMVLWLMQLTFTQNTEILAVVCVNLTGWLIWWRFRKEPAPVTVPSDLDPGLLNTSPATSRG